MYAEGWVEPFVVTLDASLQLIDYRKKGFLLNKEIPRGKWIRRNRLSYLKSVHVGR